MLKYRSQLDDSHFSAALRRMETGVLATGGKISRTLSSLGGLGSAVGFGALVAGADSAIQRFSALKDQADSLNIPVEDFQRAAFVLSQSGARAEDAQRGIANLTRSLVEARDPASKASEAVSKLGLDLAKFDTADPVSALAQMADAYRASGDRASAFSAISELVGSKVAIKLIPALSEGGAKFREMAASANVASEALVEFGDRMGDARDKALTEGANTIANHVFALGKVLGSRFTEGTEEGLKFGMPSAFAKALGLVKFMSPASLISDLFDPEEAARRAGLGGASDPEQAARDNARAIQREAERKSRVEEIDKALAASAKKKDEEILKSHTDRLERQTRADEEYSQRMSKQIQRGEKFWSDIQKDEAEQRKSIAEDDLAKAQGQQAKALADLQNAEQAQTAFSRMSPDDRRQFNRDERDERHAAARDERMKWGNAKDARPGAGRMKDEVDMAEKVAKAVAAEVKGFAQDIADAVADLITK